MFEYLDLRADDKIKIDTTLRLRNPHENAVSAGTIRPTIYLDCGAHTPTCSLTIM